MDPAGSNNGTSCGGSDSHRVRRDHSTAAAKDADSGRQSLESLRSENEALRNSINEAEVCVVRHNQSIFCKLLWRSLQLRLSVFQAAFHFQAGVLIAGLI